MKRSLLIIIGLLISVVFVIAESEEIEDNSNNVIRARAKRDRDSYSGPPVISNPTRASFPNFGDEPVAGSSPFIGFQYPAGTTVSQTRDSSSAFLFWSNSSNTIQSSVSSGCTLADLGLFNSFCDIPIPDPNTFVGAQISQVTPTPKQGITFKCPAQLSTTMFMTIWISEESFIEGGLIVFTYQYFYGTPGLFRRSVYQVPSCVPQVSKISPGFAFTTGSVIFIEGNHFGVSSDLISVKIGTFPCTDVEMVVSDSLIRCIASGNGNSLMVNVTVGSKSTQPPFQLLSFNGNCPLICNAGSYPDQNCQSCIRPQSSTDDIGTSRLSQVVSSISSDLVEATYFSDLTFMQTANFYKGNPVMEVLSIPRYTVPDVTVDMKFAIAATTPLKVTALTNLLQGYDATVIPSLELHYESQQAQWTKVDNNGTSTYRLDII